VGEGAVEKKKNMGMGGNAKKGKTTPSNKASDFNRSYVLYRASDGYVHAKFVGCSDEYIEWSIWVLRPLLLTSKDPF
jgi:hypothetical protein